MRREYNNERIAVDFSDNYFRCANLDFIPFFFFYSDPPPPFVLILCNISVFEWVVFFKQIFNPWSDIVSYKKNNFNLYIT